MGLIISSTLAGLTAVGSISPVGLELFDEDEDRVCTVYGTRTFENWRDGHLPYYAGIAECDLSPDEEVDLFLREFMLGRTAGVVTRLEPDKDGLWEVRLTQTRIFGWFETPGHLVLHDGEELGPLKAAGRSAYEAHKEAVIAERRRLGISFAIGDIRHVRSYNS